MITLVQEYFSESARQSPNKIAISCGAESMSFKDSDEFSNSFARELRAAGVKRGSFVPFFLEKGLRSVLAILSILKSDSAYVPLDINSPAQRLDSIIQSTKADVIIVDNHSEALFLQLLSGDELPKMVNIEKHRPANTSSLDYKNISIDIAYVLFTSGSTGIPKGVMIPHKAIVDYIDWCVETYHITENDIIANHAPLYFDNSTFDLYTAFSSGATLHLVPEELNAVIPLLVSWIRKNQISVFFCVPSVLTMLLKSRRLKPDSMDKLRHMICAGEVLPKDVLKEWMQLYPKLQFTNMYGPTEITVDCTYHIIRQIPDEQCLQISIGKARGNMELFIRKEDGQLTQSIGEVGELLVRGTSVSYGYLGDSIKTANSFIQNPNHHLYHDPLYCTGDRVKLEDDGNFSFLGRADDQIKFLGYRIELGEIESMLCSLEAVQEAVVVFNDDGSNSEIAALLSLEGKTGVQEVTLRLSEKLPKYMLPTRIQVFDKAFPRTPNGKYDRKAIKTLIFEHN